MANVLSFRTVGFGFSALFCALAASSCGGAQGGEDDGGGDTGGTNATGGNATGGATGGNTTGGNTTGGSATGGDSGASTGGASGSATGGASGSATGGTAGMDSCMPNPPAQTCSGAMPNAHMPADGLLINWETYTSTGTWGNSTVGDLTGGTSKYNGRDVMPVTAELSGTDLHITATIPAYTPDVADDAENYAGLVFWFGPCINASAYGGLSFSVGGTMGGAALKLQVQTAENYPADPANTKGACIFTSCESRWSDCKGPDTTVVVPEVGEPVSLTWDAFTGGSPNAGVNATGLVGLQFQLECQSQDTACVVDITLGDITLTAL